MHIRKSSAKADDCADAGTVHVNKKKSTKRNFRDIKKTLY